MEKKFWRHLQAPANFFKHADRDPDGILENIDERANEGLLYMACLFYQDLGHQYTPEMMSLVGWYIALHPEFLLENAPSQLKQVVSNAGLHIRDQPRPQQLAIGQQLLEMSRVLPRR